MFPQWQAQLAKMEVEKASKAANFPMPLSPPHGISAQLPQIDHRKGEKTSLGALQRNHPPDPLGVFRPLSQRPPPEGAHAHTDHTFASSTFFSDPLPTAVASQTTLATMLVRVRDMTVIESNAAMSLFCPFDFLW